MKTAGALPAAAPFPRMAPEVAGPWSRWPDPTKGGTVALDELGREKQPVAPTRHRAPQPEDHRAMDAAVLRYIAGLRHAQASPECITVTVHQVLDGIGLGNSSALEADMRRVADRHCQRALLLLGFEPGTRGRHPVTGRPNQVLRLAPDVPLPAACASPSSAVPINEPPPFPEPARLTHTGPIKTANAQRRLAAEKRARSGNSTR